MRWRARRSRAAREAFAQALRRVEGHALASIGLAAAGVGRPAVSPSRSGRRPAATYGRARSHARCDVAIARAVALTFAGRRVEAAPPRGRGARRGAARQRRPGSCPSSRCCTSGGPEWEPGARAPAQPRRLTRDPALHFRTFQPRRQDLRPWRTAPSRHGGAYASCRRRSHVSRGLGRVPRRPRASSSRRRSPRPSTCRGRASASPRSAPASWTNSQKRNIDVGPNISQFGWQFEKQFYTRDSGVAAVNEWVVLLGGLDQGVALPSVSWLVGLRTREGAEFGIGPNITPAGVALALAGGRDVPGRQSQRADERGRRAVEGRHADQRADRLQHAATVMRARRRGRLQAAQGRLKPAPTTYGASVSV